MLSWSRSSTLPFLWPFSLLPFLIVLIPRELTPSLTQRTRHRLRCLYLPRICLYARLSALSNSSLRSSHLATVLTFETFFLRVRLELHSIRTSACEEAVAVVVGVETGKGGFRRPSCCFFLDFHCKNVLEQRSATRKARAGQSTRNISTTPAFSFPCRKPSGGNCLSSSSAPLAANGPCTCSIRSSTQIRAKCRTVKQRRAGMRAMLATERVQSRCSSWMV